MLSIRSWLTSRFALLILGSMVLFVGAIYAVRLSAAYSDARELAEEQARLAQVVLRRISTAGAPITVRESQVEPGREAEAPQRVQLEPAVRDLLNEMGGYLWVLSDTIASGPVYQSASVRRLDSTRVDEINSALREMRRVGAPYTRVHMPGTGILVERQQTLPNGQLVRVVAAVPLSQVNLPPSELLATALLVLPIILLLSIGAAHAIAGRAMDPLHRITGDVAAITDGRSLHRRLHPEESAAEWAQLTGQLNEMIARLESSFAALRRFTADASHELKTPLAVLRADVERAMQARRGSTEQAIALEEALQETTRMADLVESLLTLARADEGRFDIVREPIDIEALAHEVFETAAILGENAGLRVTLSKSDPCVVEGDRTRLRQLFLNLVTNAIKYTPRGGAVELSLIASETEVVFGVRDTGIGIAAMDLPFVFDRFFRADRVRSRQGGGGGFGLGLSISQWIAQAHGGSLKVQSRLHRGSTFTVTLPLAGTAAAERLHAPPVRSDSQP